MTIGLCTATCITKNGCVMQPFFMLAIGSVSRVLCSTVIYLDGVLPRRSSHLLGNGRASLCFLCGVAPDRVCSDEYFRIIGCALTAPFHPYRIKKTRRYISVALFLKLPSAGVTRYPRSVEPGLSSYAAFRHSARDCPIRSRIYFTLFPIDCQTRCKKLP